MTAALETKGLCKNFGAIAVSNKIDFTLAPGARHAPPRAGSQHCRH